MRHVIFRGGVGYSNCTQEPAAVAGAILFTKDNVSDRDKDFEARQQCRAAAVLQSEAFRALQLFSYLGNTIHTRL